MHTVVSQTCSAVGRLLSSGHSLVHNACLAQSQSYQAIHLHLLHLDKCDPGSAQIHSVLARSVGALPRLMGFGLTHYHHRGSLGPVWAPCVHSSSAWAAPTARAA